MRERRHCAGVFGAPPEGSEAVCGEGHTCRYAFYGRPAGRGAFAPDKGSRCPNAGGVLCLGGTVRAHHGMAPGKNAGAEDTGGRRPGAVGDTVPGHSSGRAASKVAWEEAFDFLSGSEAFQHFTEACKRKGSAGHPVWGSRGFRVRQGGGRRR